MDRKRNSVCVSNIANRLPCAVEAHCVLCDVETALFEYREAEFQASSV